MPKGVYIRIKPIWNKGKNMPKEFGIKLSKSLSGRKLSEQHRRNVSNGLCGHIVSDETREKIAIALKGQKTALGYNWTSEQRFAASQKRKGKVGTNLGKKFSLLHRMNMSKSMEGRRYSKCETIPELIMQIALESNGIEFETNKEILGRPDIFIKPNICIFVDGNYWHNLSKAVVRDAFVTKTLEQIGYIVLRFWEKEIHSNVKNCILSILPLLRVV